MKENKHTYYGDGVVLPAGFDLHGPYPLDYRTLFTDWTNTSLSEVSADVLFVGLLASDETDKKVKILKTKPANASTAADCTWEEVGNNSASDFDIKDLADSTDLRTTWSGKLDQLTDGNGIDITSNIISVRIDSTPGNVTLTKSSSGLKADVDLSGKVDKIAGKGLSTEDYTTSEKNKLSGIETGAQVNIIKTVKVNGTALTPDANKAVDVIIPAVKHELIYSDNNQTHTTKQLRMTDGLVVDNSTDLDLCKNTSSFSMEEVARTWTRHNLHYQDPLLGSSPTTYTDLGVNDAASESGLRSVNSWHYVNKTGEDKRLYDNNTTTAQTQYTLSDNTVQDYIYNFNNPNTTTMLYSSKKYSNYYSKMAVGVEPSHNLAGYTDRIATIPMMLIDNGYLYQIEVYTNNYNDSEGWIASGNMTVGIAVRKVTIPFPNSSIDKSSTAILILDATEGLTIVPYDENLDNQVVAKSSAMILETSLIGNTLTVAFSLPFKNDGSLHDDQVSLLTDRKVTINLAEYTVTYTDKDGTAHSKDYSATGSAGTAADRTKVQDIFDHLRNKAVNRGFMQDSSPGCIWRNIKNLDGNLIAAFTKGAETVYQFNGNTWVDLHENPYTYFTGSRIAFNDVTNKLFYSDGYEVLQIATNLDKQALGTVTSITAGTGLEVASGDSNPITSSGTLNLKVANSTALGGVKSSTTGTTANRDYNVEVNSDGTMKVNVPWTDTGSSAIPVGTIQMYAGSTAPNGWLMCQGQLIELTEGTLSDYDWFDSSVTYKYYKAVNRNYVNLLKLIGGQYGQSSSQQGSTLTYVNIPNLQQKFPLGAQNNGTIGNYFDSSTSSWKSYTTTLGDTGGEDTTKLLASNLPDHSHSLLVRDSNSSNSGAWEGTGNTQKTATDKTGYNIYTANGNKVVDGTASSGQTPRTNHNNIPPFLAINFIIKY